MVPEDIIIVGKNSSIMIKKHFLLTFNGKGKLINIKTVQTSVINKL